MKLLDTLDADVLYVAFASVLVNGFVPCYHAPQEQVYVPHMANLL